MDLAYLDNQNPYDRMSFGQAFRAAHDAGETEFTWRGKRFNTNRKDKKQTPQRQKALMGRPTPAPAPSVSHREMENSAPVRPPYPTYDQDGPILQAIKTKLMAAHNAVRSPFGMDEIFPDAKRGAQVWRELGNQFSDPLGKALGYRDRVQGQEPTDYGSMSHGDKFLKYLAGTAGKTAEVGMGMTGMYQGARAMELARRLRDLETAQAASALRTRVSPIDYAAGARAEPYMP